MSAEKTRTVCLEPETLAAFAEGKLKRHEIPAVLAHLDQCPDCMGALEAANDAVDMTGRSAGTGRFRTWPLAAVAAMIVIAVGLAIALLRPVPPLERLAGLAPAEARTVEPRLSGGFAWAPYRGPLRATGDAPDARRLKLSGVAGELVEKADREGSPQSQHEAGVALVLIEQPLEAVARLRVAAGREAADARSWSDLSAAQYAAALRLDRPSLYPEALAAADRALRLDPDLPEARFNRALVLERLGLSRQAREAWQRYLEIDPSSPWATEARERLERLPETTGSSLFDRDRSRLEQAAKAGDPETVEALVRRHPQLSRGYAEFDYLARWGEALLSGDTAQAADGLAIARGIGDALARVSDEGLLREVVRSIDAADTAGRRAIADGHVLYHRGRVTYSLQRPTEAEPELLQAAAHFSTGGSPMSLVARYYAANARFDQNDVRGARARLETLLAEADARPAFAALGAQVRWQLALCHMVDEDWSGARHLLLDAESAFRRLGEQNNLGFIESLLASVLASLGRADEGWAARIRSFEILSAEGHGDRLAVSLGAAARSETRTGRPEAARALLRLEQEIDREAGSDVLLANALVREAVLSTRLGGELGDEKEASALAREARTVAGRIDDPRLRAWALADVDFAEGATTLRTDPRRARERLARAVDFYRTAERPVFLPEAHLLRARAALRLGETDEARADLEAGLAAVERHRIRFAGPVTGTGVVDAVESLLQETMRLHLQRGDIAGAFACAERSRAHFSPEGDLPIPMSELQRRLAGTGAAVLQLFLLPDEIVAVSVSENDRSMARQPATERHLARLAERALDADREAAGALYDLLIRPSEGTLAGARHLIVVAGPPLELIPFAALYDSAARQYLVESLSVAVAPSASSLRVSRGVEGQRSVIALALPAGEVDGAAALPETAAEVADLGRLYRESIEISGAQATFAALLDATGRADVVHIASHTERQGGAGDAALVFAGERNGRGRRVSWSEIAAGRLRPASVVTLAACETLRRPPLRQTRALSLAGGFLAAGAGDVVGTLTPIADADARAIFRDIHGHLAASLGPAEAVQRAQLSALASESTGRRRTAWRAVAVLTSSIPRN